MKKKYATQEEIDLCNFFRCYPILVFLVFVAKKSGKFIESFSPVDLLKNAQRGEIESGGGNKTKVPQLTFA